MRSLRPFVISVLVVLAAVGAAQTEFTTRWVRPGIGTPFKVVGFGDTILTLEDSGALKVWNRTSGGLTKTVPALNQPIWLARSADGLKAAFDTSRAGAGGTTTLAWGNLSTLSTLNTLTLPNNAPFRFAYTGNPNQILGFTVYNDTTTFELWDLVQKKVVRSWTASFAAASLCASPTEPLAFATGVDGVHVYDVSTGRQISLYRCLSNDSVSIADDGSRFSYSDTTGHYWVRNTKGGTLISNGSATELGRTELSPSGNVLALLDPKGISFVGVPGGTRLSRIPLDVPPTYGCFPTPDTFVAGDRANNLRDWNWATATELHSYANHRAPLVSVAYDLTGSRAFSLDRMGSLASWDAKTGLKINEVRFPSATPLALSPKASFVFGTSLTGRLLVYAASGILVRSIPARLHETIVSAKVAPNEKLIAVASHADSGSPVVRIYDLSTGQLKNVFPIDDHAVIAMAWSGDSTAFAVAGFASVVMWHLATPNAPILLAGGRPSEVALSEDGALAAVAFEGNYDPDSLVVIRTATAEWVTAQGRHAEQLSFVPGDKYLLAGSSLYAGDLPTVSCFRTSDLGEEYGVSADAYPKITSISQSPDGRSLLLGRADGTVRCVVDPLSLPRAVFDSKPKIVKDRLGKFGIAVPFHTTLSNPGSAQIRVTLSAPEMAAPLSYDQAADEPLFVAFQDHGVPRFKTTMHFTVAIQAIQGAVAGPKATASVIARLPVIVVHGIQIIGQDAGRDESFINAMAASGYKEENSGEYPSLFFLEYNADTDGLVHNAAYLYSMYSYVTKGNRTYADYCDVVAHSKGGLVTRETLKLYPVFASHVRRMILCCTPNSGAAFAELMRLSPAVFSSTVTRELSPTYAWNRGGELLPFQETPLNTELHELNASFPVPSSIQFYQLYGLTSPLTPVDLTGAVFGPAVGDGVVPLWSQQGYDITHVLGLAVRGTRYPAFLAHPPSELTLPYPHSGFLGKAVDRIYSILNK